MVNVLFRFDGRAPGLLEFVDTCRGPQPVDARTIAIGGIHLRLPDRPPDHERRIACRVLKSFQPVARSSEPVLPPAQKAVPTPCLILQLD